MITSQKNEVWNKITKAKAPHEDVLTSMKKWKLKRYGQDEEDLPKKICKDRCKERERGEDREEDGRTTSPSGL